VVARILNERSRMGMAAVDRPPDPASRTDYQPGEQAQCDVCFPPMDILLSGWGRVPRALVWNN